MTQIPVTMIVTECHPQGSDEDPSDVYTCSIDPKVPLNDKFKNNGLQIELDIKRSSPLTNLLQYQKPFLIYINFPDPK